MRARSRMRIAGGVAVVLGLAAAGLVVAAVIGTVGGSVGGYVCFGLSALVFGGAGVALLAGSQAVPDDWPPRDEDTR